jgi:hypothetical protein
MGRQPSQWASAPSLLRRHDHSQTHHTRYYSSGRVIGPSQAPLPDKTHNIHKTQKSAAAAGFEPAIIMNQEKSNEVGRELGVNTNLTPSHDGQIYHRENPQKDHKCDFTHQPRGHAPVCDKRWNNRLHLIATRWHSFAYSAAFCVSTPKLHFYLETVVW